MREITLQELLEAGCHFGHQVPKGHPKAQEFVYTNRDKIQIIDLVKTKKGLEEAANFLRDLASGGGKIIFLGTKKQAKNVIAEEAKRCGAFYVTERWVGGFLTNWEEVRKNLKAMDQIREELTKDKWTKKEKLLMERRLKKLEKLYEGVESLKDEQPDALYIIDVRKEKGALKETERVGIPCVAIVDTNVNPDLVAWPIPANDDAVGSIKLITAFLANAVLEGRQIFEKKGAAEEKTEEAVEKKVENKEKVAKPKAKKKVAIAEDTGEKGKKKETATKVKRVKKKT
ncbi:30S ribosomal protein S2 [Candidatus Microgenomates bacterium]|nr:30S ribosomal protein S2 [Candidatus Microgenomates bacterium]